MTHLCLNGSQWLPFFCVCTISTPKMEINDKGAFCARCGGTFRIDEIEADENIDGEQVFTTYLHCSKCNNPIVVMRLAKDIRDNIFGDGEFGLGGDWWKK